MSKASALAPATGAALLLAIGLALLVPGTPLHPATASTTTAPTSPASSAQDLAQAPPPGNSPAAPSPSPNTASSSASPASSIPASNEAMPSGIPAAGDGPQGDAAIQAAFTQAHPSDLPAADATQLADLARQVWLAETTSTGRDRWPAYFPTGQGAAPAPIYSSARIQALAAHSIDGDQNHAQVALLWAGTSPTGDYADHRPATVTFTRTTTGWEPVR